MQLTRSCSVQWRSLWARPLVELPVAVPYPNAAPFLPILSELQRGIVQPTGWARAPGPVALSPEPSIAGSLPPGRHSTVVGSPPLAGPQTPVPELPPQAFARSRELLTLARRVAMVC